MKREIFLIAITGALLLSACAGRKPQEKAAWSGNPILDGWYADPEVAVYDTLYWIFPTGGGSRDGAHRGPRFNAFSSPDLVNWTLHETILDTTMVTWIERSLWAPASIRKDGKYYLFFSANDIQHPVSSWWDPAKHSLDDVGGIGVAVAERPEGPYKDLLGKPLINEFYNDAQPIDQFVFQYTDGNCYIVYGGWGRCNIGRLKDDFTALAPFEDGDMVKEITPEGYTEGPVMFSRKGKLYFMWSEGVWMDDTYKVAYAMADSPLGPFERIGTILENDPAIATGAGHNSVLNIPGTDDWYMVYHRRPIPNLAVGHRVTCIDHMYFNEDGTIRPVVMTDEGVQAVKLPVKKAGKRAGKRGGNH